MYRSMTGVAVTLTSCIQALGAQGAEVPQEYTLRMQIYRVMTAISGDSSQTLPCSTGDIVHIINEKLDGVALHMEGAELTWNGEADPRFPVIRRISELDGNLSAGITNRSGEAADAEYFERVGDQWRFSVMDFVGRATEFTVRPDPKQDGVLINTFGFKISYVKERLPVPGVRTLNVGKPVIATIESKGEWRLRLGEWSCLRLQVPSEGRLYVFLMIRECPNEPKKD